MIEVPKPDIYIDDVSSTHNLEATTIRGQVVGLDVEPFAAVLDPQGRAAGWRSDDCFVLSLLTEQETKPRFQFVLSRSAAEVLAEKIDGVLRRDVEPETE